MKEEPFTDIPIGQRAIAGAPLYLPLLLCLLALLFDYTMPRGVAAGIAYLLLVLSARWMRDNRAPLFFAATGSALSVIVYFVKQPGLVMAWVAVTNELLTLGVIWLTAVLLFSASKREGRLREVRSHSDALLNVLTNSDDAIMSKSLDGVIRFWSGGATKLFGYSSEEIIGCNMSVLIPDDLRIEESEINDRLSHGETLDRFETRRLCKDGSTVDVSLTIAPTRDESGKVEGAIKIARDISGRKQVESALLQSEQRYALAIQGMSIGVWEWHIAANELFLSPRFKEIVGIVEERSSYPFDDLETRLHPADRRRVLDLLQAHLRHEAAFDTEFRLRGGSQRFLWVHASGQAIWDSAGVPLKMVGSIDDISERKRSEEKIRLIVQEAPYALLMANAEGVIQLVNRRMVEMFGWTRMEMTGNKVEMLIPESVREHHPGLRAKYFSAPTTIDPKVRAMGQGRSLYGLRRNGTEFPVEIGFISLQAEEEKLVLCSIIDVTERKKIEEQNRLFNEILEAQVTERTEQLTAANKELEQFAFIASHDLKAPLRVIDNASKWLEEDLSPHLNDDTRESMSLLRNRVRRMEKLLDDLLEYSRIGRKMDASYRERVSGNVLMEDILQLLGPPEGFEIDVDPHFSSIEIPRMPLQQILYNLINNAIKHHHRPNGQIQVKVQDAGADYLFMVQDDGPGIPQRFHEDVFRMFQTLKPRDQVEGSGMGLAVARKQVEVLGGTLTLQSEEGKGCLFCFTFPKTGVAERCLA